MYLEYWGLQKNPFDSVPDPGMYFSEHSSVEDTVAELMFAIEEGNECLAVVVGEVGLGKTMALRVVLNELSLEKYRVVFITNPDVTFPQLLREIIGQLVGETCRIRDKELLLEKFNRILFETADSDRKVLIFIDEGNSMKSPVLEGLRLLTNMQEDTRNLLTIVVAGQPKLGKMLEHPARANLFQRIGVYSRLEPMSSVELVKDYVEHRLERAGCAKKVFDEEAFEAIFEHSQGTPRLINRVCKLALKAGETNGFERINAETIRAIARRFEPRRKTRTKVRKRTPEAAESTRNEAQEKVPAGPVAVENLPRSRAEHEHEPAIAAAAGRVPETARDTGIAEPKPNGCRIRPINLHVNGIELWSVPPEALRKLQEMPAGRERLRFAGQLAAQELRQYPERFMSPTADPVQVWDKLRSDILENIA